MLDFANLIIQWITQYGLIALFPALALGILGLPIPDETLITIAGAFIATERWSFLPTCLIVVSGAICGITLSYLLGRSAGHLLLIKYGAKIGFTEAKLQRTHQWFERIGKWSLVIGYFIPGVRHFTGYIAGSVDLSYKEFALFAYSGAIIWSAIFLSLGYFFGGKLPF